VIPCPSTANNYYPQFKLRLSNLITQDINIFYPNKRGKIREEKVVVRELMQKVHLQIQEKIDLSIEDKKAGIVFNILK
jgi:hypothetical protein